MMTPSLRDELLLAGYCTVIFLFSHQPAFPHPHYFLHQDKLHHLLAYAVMAVFAWRAFSHRIPLSWVLWLSTVLFCSLYGVSDEFHQSFISERNSEVADWLADTLGAVMTSTGVYIYHHKRNESVAEG